MFFNYWLLKWIANGSEAILITSFHSQTVLHDLTLQGKQYVLYQTRIVIHAF